MPEKARVSFIATATTVPTKAPVSESSNKPSKALLYNLTSLKLPNIAKISTNESAPFIMLP